MFLSMRKVKISLGLVKITLANTQSNVYTCAGIVMTRWCPFRLSDYFVSRQLQPTTQATLPQFFPKHIRFLAKLKIERHAFRIPVIDYALSRKKRFKLSFPDFILLFNFI